MKPARRKVLSGPRPIARGPRLLALTFALFTLCLAPPAPALAWGPIAHDVVTTWAIQTLPPEIRSFFENNRDFLLQHANDPDELIKTDRYERMRHYIYLDKYGLFPYPNLPHDYLLAKEKFTTSRIGRDGMLPWQIGEFSLRLTKAIKAGNWEEVKLDAADLAHYIADAHDPLHTTQNYDGQLTQQTGLSSRFDIHLFERYSKLFIMHPESADKIDDPTQYAFQTCLSSNVWVDLILWSDLRARDGLANYTDEYYDRFYNRIGPTVVREINDAAYDVGSYWYTAWLNAGHPQLPSR
jgi:hypothetical protein